MQNLDEVFDALSDIASVSSRNLKLEKLGKYLGEVRWLEETIEFALNPYKQFHISKVKEVECSKLYATLPVHRLFLFLYELTKQRGATNQDRDHLNELSSITPKTVEVVKKIITKDLRCGVQAKTAKKFIPDLPIYEVMKAEGDNPFPGKNWDKFLDLMPNGIRDVCWAIKLDGFRVSYVVVHKDGLVEYLSTAGKPYPNFSVFDKEVFDLANLIKETAGSWCPDITWPIRFDGECVTKDGDFQSVQKHARRLHNVDPEVYRLLLWDVLLPIPYQLRYDLLDSLVTVSGEKYNFLEIVEIMPDKVFRLKHNFGGLPSTDHVTDLTRAIIADGNEGIVAKTPQHMHELKRSKHWFKLKALYLKGEGIEVDLPVIGLEYGRKGTRLENMLGAFVCEYKGNRVRVSGRLSDKQRIRYAEDLPSVIEVHADSETNDESLRLPIFQKARYDK